MKKNLQHGEQPLEFFKTSSKVKVLFTLPELQKISWKAHITKAPMSYDMIIGQDFLTALRIDFEFSSQTIELDRSEMQMRDSTKNKKNKKIFQINDSDNLKEATELIKGILDANTNPTNLNKLVQKYKHLSPAEQSGLEDSLEQK